MGLGYAATIEALKSKDKSLYSSSVIRSKFQPRAKRILFLFMKGGPSQVDTFDFKPRLQGIMEGRFLCEAEGAVCQDW